MLALLFFLASTQTLHYWIDPCDTAASECRASDPELASWAMQAWQKAAGGLLRAQQAANPQQAQIRLHWVGARDGVYGEVRGAEVYVRPAPAQQDALLRDTIVYLTCLHELGHALGLAHTARFDDIMYSFQFGGDIPEYFGRYRRLLQVRSDIPKYSGMSEADRARLLVLLRK